MIIIMRRETESQKKQGKSPQTEKRERKEKYKSKTT